MRYDANGNLAQMIGCKQNSGRLYEWDEENRLRFVLGEKFTGYYGYNANGERVYKLTGQSILGQVNSGSIKAQAIFDDAVLYVNPYFIVTPTGYTKQYYNGMQHIATRIGELNYLPENIIDTSALGMERLMNARSYMDTLFVRSVSLRPDTTATFVDIDREAFPELQWQGVDSSLVWTLAIESDSDMLYPVLTKDTSCLDPRVSGVYYYHSDHLGSAAWVTHGAQAVQFVHYMPFGEMWYNQQGSAYNERYKFTGKERDAETGYDYFGARYYASCNLSWLSVDPLSDKYPNISPYAYCAWNPISRIDPDGRDWYKAEDGSAVLWKNSNDASINIDGVTYNNIGENFDHVQGNTTYTYHQNELYSISTDVMSEKNFISQFSRGDNWDDETLAKFACQKACDAMLSSAGYKSAAPSNDFVIVENLNGTGSAGAANKNAKQAIRMMADNLYAGFPSKVSVDHRPGTGSHADKIGDHFVVIRGVTEYLSRGQVIGAEYRFFDPGTRLVNNGTAGKLNLTNERLVGVAPYGSHRPYTVSSIRLCR